MNIQPASEAGDASGGLVRCFVALLLDTAVRDELLAVQKLLRAHVAEGPVRWARLAQLHLTLRFLGGVRPGDLPALGRRLGEACARHGPFRLELGGLGLFPDARQPRVIWVGLRGELEALMELQRSVEGAVGSFSAKVETRSFQPHLTLGRVASGASAAGGVAGALAAVEVIERVSWTVREVHLMRSDLEPEGARYAVVSTAPLSTAEGDGSAVGGGMGL